MKVVVIGAGGQLGSDLVPELRDWGHDVNPLLHAELDVTDAAACDSLIPGYEPDVVVNCAAYVRVNDAEKESDLAFSVNALGALNVARSAQSAGAMCVYVSTDYVFDGDKSGPYLESDAVNPLNVYGCSKLAGEYLTRQSCDRSLIVRVASLFGIAGSSGKGGNFIESIIARAESRQPIEVIDDLTISPTFTADASRAMVEMIRLGSTGIVHSVNSPPCTWYDLASYAVSEIGLDVPVGRTKSSAYPSTARRPVNTALASNRMAQIGVSELPAWQDAVSRYIQLRADRSHGPGKKSGT